MQINGHHGPVPPPEPTSILIGFALRIGRLEGAVFHQKPPQSPQRDWVNYLVGMLILGLAAAGKVTWQDALPSLLGHFTR